MTKATAEPAESAENHMLCALGVLCGCFLVISSDLPEAQQTRSYRTVNMTEAVCERLPLAPRIVRVNVPLVVLLAVRTVSVDALPVVLFGLKLPVPPAGSPLTVKATAPANPPVLVTATL